MSDETKKPSVVQDVSPAATPTKDFIKSANDLLRQLNREVFNNAVDPLSLPHAVDLVCKFAENHAESDVRELKAALRELVQVVNCDGDFTSMKEFHAAITEAERVLAGLGERSR